VDGDDLTRWRNGFGTGATHVQGDANADSDVDGADFLTWQRQLGGRASNAAMSTAVPEPATALLPNALAAAVSCQSLGRAVRRERHGERQCRSLRWPDTGISLQCPYRLAADRTASAELPRAKMTKDQSDGKSEDLPHAHGEWSPSVGNKHQYRRRDSNSHALAGTGF
jgi:hypothetical protein